MKGDGRGMIYFSSSVSHLSQSLLKSDDSDEYQTPSEERSNSQFEENPTKTVFLRNELTL
jgi:hypothetical protein